MLRCTLHTQMQRPACQGLQQGTITAPFGCRASCVINMLNGLPKNVQLQILHNIKQPDAQCALASSNRELCRSVRSTVRSNLDVSNDEQAGFVIRSCEGGACFSGCRQLKVAVNSGGDYLKAVGAISAAGQFTALRHLQLTVKPRRQQGLPPGAHSSIICTPLLGLRHLRQLELALPDIGVLSAQHIAQLTCLTRLQLGVSKVGGDYVEDAAADLTPLSGLPSLVELEVDCTTRPAAGAGGPYCIPSSVTSLWVHRGSWHNAARLAGWATHLPGCPLLQQLRLDYGLRAHDSVDPAILLPRLARHNLRLRFIVLSAEGYDPGMSYFTRYPPDGVEAVGDDEEWHWRSNAALASLTGLECLASTFELHVEDEGDWQRLAQLTGLTSLRHATFKLSASPMARTSLGLLELQGGAWMSAVDLGQLLLACPVLRTASIRLITDDHADEQAAGIWAAPHPTLQAFELGFCGGTGPEAAADLAVLAPLLVHVSALHLVEWVLDNTGFTVPDLSFCTALTRLCFCCDWGDHPHVSPVWPSEAQLLSMVEPLSQLRVLKTPVLPPGQFMLRPRAVPELQDMLPQLQLVRLCQDLRRRSAAEQQGAAEILADVRQQLRPGLCLEVTDSAAEEFTWLFPEV
jgi:hypothetical protein